MIKFNAILGMFSKNNKSISNVEKEIVKVVETPIPLSSRNCLNPGDSVAFGFQSAPKDFSAKWVEANKNLNILKQANMPQDVIKVYQETRIPTLKYLGESALSPNQQKFSKHMQDFKLQEKLDKQLQIANAQVAKAEKRAADMAKYKDGYVKAYLDGQYGTKYSELMKSYPELATPSAVMGFLKKEKVDSNPMLRHDLLDEMVNVLKTNKDEAVEKEFVGMLTKDIETCSKKLDRDGSLTEKFRARIEKNIATLAGASNDKKAFAKELEEALSFTTNADVRASYMFGLAEYGSKNPSDLSFIDVIIKSGKDKLGNSAYAKRGAYSALSSFDGQYNSLKEIFAQTPNNDTMLNLLRSAKTDAQKQDFAKYILGEVKEKGANETSETLHNLIYATSFSNDIKWIKSGIIRPLIDMGVFENTNMEKTLISALSK